MIRAPVAAPNTWWPRQTPNNGTRPSTALTNSTEIPASNGPHGPGEMTIALGRRPADWLANRPANCSTVTASLRITSASMPNSSKYLARL